MFRGCPTVERGGCDGVVLLVVAGANRTKSFLPPVPRAMTLSSKA